MSIHILTRSLNNEQINMIAKLLKITPKKNNNYFNSYNKYKKNKHEDEKDVINMYEPMRVNNQDIIKLPYQFARLLLNIPIPNNHMDIHYDFKGKLYESQIQISMDAINSLTTNGSVILNLYTSFGKTVMGAYLGAWSKKITLVLYTSTVLQPQWHKTFKEFTNANVWVVGEIDPPVGGTHVILCMNTRIDKIPKSFLAHVGTVIYDEVDTFCTKGRLNCWLDITPKYIIAATATLKRSDGMEQMITAACGSDIIRKISTKPFVVYKYLTGIIIEQKKNIHGKTDWNLYQKDRATNEERNRQILSIIQNNINSKILVITSRKEDHAIPLYNWVKFLGYDVDYMAGTKKKYQDSKILIGTYHKIGRGFDEKAACDSYNGIRIDLMIITCSFAEDVPLEQIAGRVFRSDFPRIVYMVDESNIATRHWNMAKKWFESRKGIINIVESLNYINNIKGKDLQLESQNKTMSSLVSRHKNMKMI